MNKKLILTTLLIVYYNLAFSQIKDTLYYDIYWKNTTKEKADFFRPQPVKNKQGLYIVKDYFIEGMLQMEGLSKDIEGAFFEGKVSWYYENGNKEVERTYSNGSIEGEVNSYFDNGILMSSGIFKNNEAYSGNFNAETMTDKMHTYIDGVIVSESYYYEDTKTIAKKRYYPNNSSKGISAYFNKKGVVIATKYDDDSENKTSYKVLEVFHTKTTLSNFDNIFFVLFEIENNGILQHIIKDSNQNIIGQGTIKNEKPYTGKFFKDHQLIEYKEGVENGEVIFYTKEYQKTAVGVYKDGEKFSGEFYDHRDDQKEVFQNGNIIAKRTKNKHTGEEYYCEFEDYTPINGDYLTNRKLETYKNKKLVKSVVINSYSGLKKKTTFYGKDKYDITKEIHYEGEEEYILTYKDGRPFEGRDGSEEGYITYTNGEISGPFSREEYREAIISGNYKNHKKEGKITYIIYNTKDTVTCLFKEDKPISGTIFEQSKLISYKNGKKEGCGYEIINHRNYVYDSIQMCYKGGSPSGTKKYYKENEFVTELTYKSGKPFNGTSFTKKYKTVYKDGKKIENELFITRELYKQQFFNLENQLTKEIIKQDSYTDSTLYTVTYKKGKPYQGIEIVYDNVNEVYKKTSYIKGKKEGIQSIYKYLDKHFIAQYNYKKDKREGTAKFKINPFTDTIYKIEYKKDKPYTGTLIENEFENKNNYKKTYNKGNLQSITYYQYSKDKELTTIDFKNDKPYNGFFLKDNEYDKDVKEYKDGNLATTYIKAKNFNGSKPTRYDTKIYHYPLKDSIVNRYKNNISITYDSDTKKSGEVYYQPNTLQSGYASFKNNKLVTFNFNRIYIINQKFSINLVDDFLVYETSQKEFRMKFKVKKETIKKPHYQFFSEKTDWDLKLTNYVELYLDDSNTPNNIVEIKNGKPYNGMIYRSEGDLFYARVFEKGEKVNDFEKLTKQELLDKIEELTAK